MDSHERAATRTCKKCGIEKPETDFYRRPKARCKACVLKDSKEQYERTKERVLARCAEYRAENKDKIKSYLKDWYQQNKDHVLARCKEYRKSPEVRERERQRLAKAYAENRDEIQRRRKAYYEANPNAKQAFDEYAKRHYAEKKYLYTAKVGKRRSRKLHATPAWADMKAINRVYKLAADLTKQTGVQHEVDHIVPLQGRNVCGLHVEWNLQVIPATENRRKFNRLWLER